MISVGSRDVRRGLGLGLGFGGGREMEETELEEGEACYDQDDAANIDPDVALSYLDEKVQVVLGHFQKDFEGGVSAESLGSKFGAYGSFLPTHQRSPSILPHPRTPQRVQNNGTPTSPNNLLVEGVCQNSSIPSSMASLRLGPASTSAAPPPPPVSSAPSVENTSKKDVHLSSSGTGEFTPKYEPVNRSINSTDHKPLKVRIKMCPDNMAEKNAAIYSGLGLDISPSSSPEDSPIESGGLSPESQNTSEKSPTSILKIMTSFPVPASFLLSPLHDSLLQFMEKEKLMRDTREEERVLLEKKMRPVEKNGRPVELKNGNSKDVGNDISDLLRKDIDIETQAGMEHVSNALKLPLPTNLKCNIGETAKGTVRASDVSREANKSVVKEKFNSFDFTKVEELDSIGKQDVNRADKHSLNGSLTDKVWEDGKSDNLKDVQVVPKKDGRKKFDIINDPLKFEIDGSMGRKDLNGGPLDYPKEKVIRKATSHEHDGRKMSHGKEKLSSRGNKKSKRTQSNGNLATECQKEGLRIGSLSTPKDKKKINDDYPSERKQDGSKFQKDYGETRDSHRDLLVDMKMEYAENFLVTPYRDRPKETKFEVAEKEINSFVDKSKERSNGKKADNTLASEPNSKPPSVAAFQSTRIPANDSLAAVAAPLVIEENWVCCDRCQKWRLLPYGRNPDNLPKKWLCSMLDWLRPGMNRCTISEEETTKAFNALYLPLPENPNNLISQPNISASVAPSSEARSLDQLHQDGLHPMPKGGKKRNGTKEIANVAGCNTGLTPFSDSTMKDNQASMKFKILNDDNQSPLESDHANKGVIQHLSKSSDSTIEKKRERQKEKHRLVQDGGDTKRSKTKGRKEVDEDEVQAYKRNKTDGFIYEDCNSDQGGNTGKMGSQNGFAVRVSATNVEKYDEYSFSKDSMSDAKDKLPGTAKNPKNQVQVALDSGTLDMGRSAKLEIAVKKRKVKEWQENQVCSPESFPNNDHSLQDTKAPTNEITNASDLRKEKKPRVHKSERKESSNGKECIQMDRIGKETQVFISGRDPIGNGIEDESRGYIRDQQLVQHRGGNAISQRALEDIDALKRDLGYGQPSLAATSSSSKVSDSQKSKANLQDVKGSPVESVSSSPMRISNPEKLPSARRVLLGKDYATNIGLSVMGSPGGGSNRSGTVRKEKTPSVIRESLDSSVFGFQDRDASLMEGGKAKGYIEPSSHELDNHLNVGADTFEQHNEHLGEQHSKDHIHGEERLDHNHYHPKGPLPKNSGKASSSRSKDKQKGPKSDSGKGKTKINNLSSEQELDPTKNSKYEMPNVTHGHTGSHEESRDEKYRYQEKGNFKSMKDENNYSGKKSLGKCTSEDRKQNQSKVGGLEGSDSKPGATDAKNGKSDPQQNLPPDHNGEKSSHRSYRTVQVDAPSGRGKSHLFPHSGDKQDTQTRCPRPTSGTSGVGGDASKVPKQPRRPDNQNGAHHSGSIHSTANGLVVGDLDAPSPLRKDSSTQAAANALKEAKDLKHSADRLKNLGSILETTGLYFQAALKFLHGASLLEHGYNESAKHGEMTQSMGIYSSTAKLCAFVAHEYERCKEMAAAALAYKCMEVAYMRVIYFKHSSASKDRNELQTALQMVPPGESPSSSASDVDNLNQGTLDKLALAKGVNSPHVAGNHVIAARNRPNFVRLLNFAEDVNFAMEASRKSQNAFAAANVSLEGARYEEGISSIKRVLDFNFHDVQGLLRLVRLAMEAISR